MSSKAPAPVKKPAIKRIPSVSKPTPKTTPKPVVKKKAKPVKPHHKFWTRKGNWKKSKAWVQHCEEEKKKEQPKKK